MECTEELVAQQNVPAILFSHRVSPGLLRYQKNYEPRATVQVESFKLIAKELLDFCNSDAYIFINVPGLRKLDFVDYADELPFLQRYVNSSSTKLKFEQVKSLPSDTYTELISYTKEKCQFEGHIRLSGNNSDDFSAYIDTGKRIIEMNYSLLPTELSARNESISHFDKYLREILAQIPSPHHTIFITSLEPQLVPEKDRETMEILPELFKDVKDVEKNNMKLNVAPLVHKYSPKFHVVDDVQVSIFDDDFLQNYKGLLSGIVVVSVGYIGWLVTQQLQQQPSRNEAKPSHEDKKLSRKPTEDEKDTNNGKEKEEQISDAVSNAKGDFSKHMDDSNISSTKKKKNPLVENEDDTGM